VPLTLSRLTGGGATASAKSASPIPAGEAATADTVRAFIDGLEYSPARLEVARGTTIVWTNRAPLAHTVTGDDGSWGSPLLEPDGSWSHTFDRPGTYPFHCAPHPFMKGVVVVRE
jgi:plastocyanin